MSKRTKTVIVLALVGIFIVVPFILSDLASYDVAFNRYTSSNPSNFVRLENYFAQTFGGGLLVGLVAIIFSLIWALRAHNQKRHANLFLIASAVAVALEFGITLVTIPLSRIDCAQECVWYILPDEVSQMLAIIGGLYWLAVSFGIFLFMRKSSTD